MVSVSVDSAYTGTDNCYLQWYMCFRNGEVLKKICFTLFTNQVILAIIISIMT